MATTTVTKEQITRLQLLADCRVTALCERYGIRRPCVKLDLRGVKAGLAYFREWFLRLNPVLFADNEEYFLNVTIPHELCHLWHKQLGLRGAPHGQAWKMLMQCMGINNPKTTHSLEVDHLRRKTTTYQMFCACRKHIVSPTRYQRWQRGKMKYFCRLCKAPLVGAGSAEATS